MSSEQQPQAKLRQVCFVIDTTCVFKHYFHKIRLYLIESILAHFAKLGGGTEYGLVLFQDHPPFCDYLVKSIPFTSSVESFVRRLDQILFYGGAGSTETAVAEGLAACLTDMDWKTIPNETIDKFCILVGSKPHRHRGCMLVGQCENMHANQIAQLLVSQNIYLSVISPFDHMVTKDVFAQGKVANITEQIVDSKNLFGLEMYAALRGFHVTEWLHLKPANHVPASNVPTDKSKPVASQPETSTSAESANKPAVNQIANAQTGPQAKKPVSKHMQINSEPVAQITLSISTGDKVASCELHAFNFVPQHLAGSKEEIQNRLLVKYWPKTVTIRKKLPEFKQEWIEQGLKKHGHSLCLWKTVKDEKSQQTLTKLVEGMVSQKKCNYIILGSQNECLALFPYSFYSAIKKSTPLPTTAEKNECMLISILFDKPPHFPPLPQQLQQPPAKIEQENPMQALMQGIPTGQAPMMNAPYGVAQQIYAQAHTNPYGFPANMANMPLANMASMANLRAFTPGVPTQNPIPGHGMVFFHNQVPFMYPMMNQMMQQQQQQQQNQQSSPPNMQANTNASTKK